MKSLTFDLAKLLPAQVPSFYYELKALRLGTHKGDGEDHILRVLSPNTKLVAIAVF